MVGNTVGKDLCDTWDCRFHPSHKRYLHVLYTSFCSLRRQELKKKEQHSQKMLTKVKILKCLNVQHLLLVAQIILTPKQLNRSRKQHDYWSVPATDIQDLCHALAIWCVGFRAKRLHG